VSLVEALVFKAVCSLPVLATAGGFPPEAVVGDCPTAIPESSAVNSIKCADLDVIAIF